MRFKEMITDLFIRTSMFEMANDRATVTQQTHNLTPNIIAHLVKILMFGKDCRSYHHWCSEVNAPLRRIQLNKLKGSNKPLGHNKLFEILFEGPLGHTNTAEEWMSLVWDEKDNQGEYKYRSLPIVQPNGVIIHGELRSILDKLSIDISNQIFRDIVNYI